MRGWSPSNLSPRRDGCHEPLPVPRTKYLDNPLAYLGRAGQSAGRVRPHARKIEPIETWNRFRNESMPSLEFRSGLPGHVGSLPVTGIALIRKRCGNVNHLYLIADAGEPRLQRPDAGFGGSLLLCLVCRGIILELLPVRPLAKEHA